MRSPVTPVVAEPDTPGQSVRSGAVVVAGRAAQLALQFALQLVLLRILTPEDVGVMAWVFPLALVVQQMANGGVQSAVLRHRELNDVEASALFWASLPWSATLAVAMSLAGGGLTLSRGDARYLPLATVWALVIFIASLAAIPEARLKRQFRFGTVLTAHLASLVVSAVVAVFAARAGARHWSFVIQIAVVELGRVSLVWLISGWRPLARRQVGAETRDAVQELRHYWRGFAGARLVGWIGEYADRLVLGAVHGATTLGLYEVGRRWGSFAFLEPYQATTEVAVATLGRARDETARLTRYARNAFLPLLALSLPVAGFLAAEPRGVLQFLFGARYVDAAPILRWTAVAIAFAGLDRLTQWVALATGHTHRQLHWMLVTTPALVVAVLVGVRWGGVGVAIGVATVHLLTAIPAVVFLLGPTGVRPRDVLPVWAIPVVASVIAAAVLHLADARLPHAAAAGGLVVRGLVFVAVYLVVWGLIPGGRALLRDARPTAR